MAKKKKSPKSKPLAYAKSTPLVRPKLELAGVWPRLAAIGYESLLIGAILFAAAGLAIGLNRGAIAPGTLWFELYLLAVPMLYLAYCWQRSGQTLPMMAWRLLVCDQQGKRLKFPQALLRAAVSTVLMFGLLGLVWQYFDADGLALQDRLSQTRVLLLPKNLT